MPWPWPCPGPGLALAREVGSVLGGGVKASPSREFTIGGHCTLQKYTLKVLNLNGRISIFLDQVPCAQIVLCVLLSFR